MKEVGEPASCANCKHNVEGKCELKLKPDERGLCDRYEMCEEFRKKVVQLMMKDVMKQIKSIEIPRKSRR